MSFKDRASAFLQILRNHGLALGVLLIFSFGFLGSYYGDILTEPNRYMFGNTGDQLKNYFTPAYHLKHGKSLVENEGMNYPYGEHYFYTDEHPGLVSGLMMMKGVGIDTSGQTVGLINLFMLLSIPFSALVLYLLLNEFRLRKEVAVVGALSIALLAPQTWRMVAHFSLSYSFFIPLAWYLCIRLVRAERKRWWIVGLTFLNLVALFTHAYIGLMTSGFALLFLAIAELRTKADLKSIRRWIPALVAGAFPLGFLKLFLLATDHHELRDGYPWGLFSDHGSGLEFIRPYGGFTGDRILSVIPGMHTVWEAWCYLGLITVLGLLAGLVLWPISTRKKVFIEQEDDSMRMWRIGMIATIPMLLFSLGLPHEIWPRSADYLGFLKQFRATGRFAWPFYFAAASLAFILTNQLYIRIQGGGATWWRRISATVFILLMGWLYYEDAKPMHQIVSKRARMSNNLFKEEYLFKEGRGLLGLMDPEQHQAIVPLPIFLIGNEHYVQDPDVELAKTSLVTSYHSGIPVLSAYLSHTGLYEARNIDQVTSPDWFPREIAKDVEDDRSFFLIAADDLVEEKEQRIIERARKLGTFGRYSAYEISKRDLFASSPRPKDQEMVGEDLLLHLDFDEDGNAEGMVGRGYRGEKVERSEIFSIPVSPEHKGQPQMLTMWFENVEDRAVNHGLRAVVFQIDGNDTLGMLEADVHRKCWGYDDWALLQLPIELDSARTGILSLQIYGMFPKYGGQYLLDEVKLWSDRSRPRKPEEEGQE